jgi:hypothetical protein
MKLYDKLMGKLFEDMLMDGQKDYYDWADRKWYNPMRWIRGKRVFRRVRPSDFRRQG